MEKGRNQNPHRENFSCLLPETPYLFTRSLNLLMRGSISRLMLLAMIWLSINSLVIIYLFTDSDRLIIL